MQSCCDETSSAAKVSEAEVHDWLKKKAVWQMFPPVQRHILHPMIAEDRPTSLHKADLLYLPHDKVSRKPSKYARTVVDVTSRYKEAEPLIDKSMAEVAAALGLIYKRSN